MKATKLLSLTLTLVIVISLLTSCGGSVADSGTAKLVILGDSQEDTTVYDIKLDELDESDEGVFSLLEALRKRGELEYSVTEGIYGAYIDSIGKLTPELAKNEYIAVFTSEACDFSTGDLTQLDYQGTTLAYAGVGISSMTVNDGTVILFRIESY